MELFRIFFFCKIHWKERLPRRSFLMNFARYLKQLFPRIPQKNCFCSTEKYFANKIEKIPMIKAKKWKQFVRKTTTHAKQKLNHYLHQVFISFYYSKISLFLFCLLPLIYWKHQFSETMQCHWGFIYYRKLFLTFGLKKIIFLFIRL